jgi:hypothetical protein
MNFFTYFYFRHILSLFQNKWNKKMGNVIKDFKWEFYRWHSPTVLLTESLTPNDIGSAHGIRAWYRIETSESSDWRHQMLIEIKKEQQNLDRFTSINFLISVSVQHLAKFNCCAVVYRYIDHWIPTKVRRYEELLTLRNCVRRFFQSPPSSAVHKWNAPKRTLRW